MTLGEWLESQNALNSWNTGDYVMGTQCDEKDAEVAVNDGKNPLFIKRLKEVDLNYELTEADRLFMIPKEQYNRMLSVKNSNKVFMAEPNAELGYDPNYDEDVF